MTSPPSSLQGHKCKVTVGDICSDTEEQLITCSKDRVILWSVDSEGLPDDGVTVARDMGQMSSCRLVVEGRRGWTVLGVGTDLWLLRLSYNKQRTSGGLLVVKRVDKHAVIETQHTGNISHVWLQPTSQTVMSAAEDCKVRIWSFQGELADTIVGSRYPVNCISVNTDQLIAVGDCGGQLRIYQKLDNNIRNVVTTINIAAIFVQHLQAEDDQSEPGCDILSVRIEETERKPVESREEDLPSLLTAKLTVSEEILSTSQTCLVGTNLGFCVLDLRSRSALQIVVFSQLTSSSPSSVLSGLASRLVLSR